MLFYETLFHNNIFSCLGIHGVLHSRAGTLSGDPVGVRRGFSPPRFEKGLTRKCSWRCVAIFFVVLAVIGFLQLVFETLTVIPQFRVLVIKWKLSPLADENTIKGYLRGFEIGDWFLLYQISKNMDKHFRIM